MPDLAFHELIFPRPLDVDGALARVKALVTDPSAPAVALELRAEVGRVRYLLGTEHEARHRVTRALGATAIELADDVRRPITTARKLTISNRRRPLNTDALEASARTILGALSLAGKGEQLVVQILIGPHLSGLVIPSDVRQPVPVAKLLVGDGNGRMDSEARIALVRKVTEPGVCLMIRAGVIAKTPQRRQALLLGLLGALRHLEAPGVQISYSPENPDRLDQATRPFRWKLRFNASELAAITALPVGDELPGLPSLHPKRLAPTQSVFAAGKNRTVIGDLTADGISGQLTRSVAASLRHTWVLGPTGTGKSTLLANMILADIAAGRGCAVIEPKGLLVDDVLRRLPREHWDRVVILDPTDSAPVGLNILAGPGSNEVRTDEIVWIFRNLFADSWGPRTADIITAAVGTLARHPNASLVMLPLLLTNPAFRAPLAAKAQDDLGLQQFWAQFNSWSEGERAQAIAPTLNKTRTILLRPALRAVLGQASPRFDVRQIFDEGKILLVALREDRIGVEAASLLGSFVVSQIYAAAKERHTLPDAAKKPVGLYIDEVQKYLHLSGSLSDSLALARSAGLGVTVANQYINQLPKAMHAAFVANCLNKIMFQLGADDAATVAKRCDELDARDLRTLSAYSIYGQMWEGHVRPYVSARTLPLAKPSVKPDDIRAVSRANFGRDRSDIEAEFKTWVNAGSAHAPDGPVGRRRRASAPISDPVDNDLASSQVGTVEPKLSGSESSSLDSDRRGGEPRS